MNGKFTAKTKDRLADKAGNVCSAPWCDRSTSASSESRASGVSVTAEAAHIRGRTQDAARWDKSMDDDQRAHISNGIHLCEDHAKLIDNDEALYTPELLEQWKQRQITLAREAQKVGWAAARVDGLIPHAREWAVSPTQDVSAKGVHDFVRAVGASAAWDPDAAKDVATLVIEIALNASRHAGATRIALRSGTQSISLSYDESAVPFGLHEWRSVTNGNGGQAFLDMWSASWGSRFSLTSKSLNGRRIWTVRNLAVAPEEGAVCSVQVSRESRSSFDSATLDGCDVAQVHLAGQWSFSDIFGLVCKLDGLRTDRPVLVTSEDGYSLNLLIRGFERGDLFGGITVWSDAVLLGHKAT